MQKKSPSEEGHGRRDGESGEEKGIVYEISLLCVTVPSLPRVVPMVVPMNDFKSVIVAIPIYRLQKNLEQLLLKHKFPLSLELVEPHFLS